MRLIDCCKMLLGSGLIVLACSSAPTSENDSGGNVGGSVGVSTAMADSGGGTSVSYSDVTADCSVQIKALNGTNLYAVGLFPGKTADQLSGVKVIGDNAGPNLSDPSTVTIQGMGYHVLSSPMWIQDGQVMTQCGTLGANGVSSVYLTGVRFVLQNE
jgi:hypothetical protein